MFRLIRLFFAGFLITACVPATDPVTTRNSQLTQGNVQINVNVGKTTKADILKTFGAPNITTRDSSGKEIWTYQRAGQASQASAASGGWTVLLAGQNYASSGFESSSRMITLKITFNSKDIVSDFASRTSNF